jgi:hypothetical protein
MRVNTLDVNEDVRLTKDLTLEIRYNSPEGWSYNLHGVLKGFSTGYNSKWTVKANALLKCLSECNKVARLTTSGRHRKMIDDIHKAAMEVMDT